jgi:hypothetical protein
MSAILQKYPARLLNSRQELISCYQRIRNTSAAICAPSNLDDYQIQSIVETNPPIWHLAHVTWFFELFLLKYCLPDYQPFNPDYSYCLILIIKRLAACMRVRNAIYSRPTLEQVYHYRSNIDKRMIDLLTGIDES